MTLRVADVVATLEARFPPDTAMSWDRVGLVIGDPSAAVHRIHLALDPTRAVVTEAVAAGADLLVTHHPLLLRGVHTVTTTTAKGSVVTAAIGAGLALYCAHTNADVAVPGVSDALADALGVRDVEPLDTEEGQPLGRVGELAGPMSLREFARHVAARLPGTAGGIRVAGPPDATVRRVAVLGGSGDDRFSAVRRAGADVYVTADLRHHPALEAREEDHDGPPYLVDAGHWASESVWLGSLARLLPADLGYAAAEGPADTWRRPDGTTVEVVVSSVRTDPWTFVVGARGPGGEL